MTMYVRRRRATSSRSTTIVTFFLGFGIGFTLCYAWLRAVTADAPSVPAPAAAPVAQAAPVVDPVDVGTLAGFEPARHLFVAVPGEALPDGYAAFLGELRPGGVLLGPGNVHDADQARGLATAIGACLGAGEGAPALIAVDPSAVRSFPAQAGSPVGDMASAREAGRALADACKSHGITVVLGPDLSLADTEAPDPGAAIALGLAYADGLMRGGVIPVAKNYPGKPSETRDGVPVLAQDVTALAHTMLPFAEAAAKGMPGILAGPVAVPAIDTRFPDRPASLSPVLVAGVLRGDRDDFDGVVLAADIAAPPLAGRYAPEQAAVEALVAGCDAVLFSETDPGRIRAVCAAIARAVQQGLLTRDRLEESRLRLEGWQAWLRDPQPLKGPLPDTGPLRLASAPAPSFSPMETPASEDPTPEPVLPKSAPEPEPVGAEAEAEPEAVPVPQPEVPPAAEADAAPEPEIVSVAEAVVEPPPADEAPMPETETVSEEEATAPKPAPAAEGVKIQYQVKQGDMLSRLAKEFGVTQKQVMDWNGLKDPNLRWGTRLEVYVTPERASQLGYGPDGAPTAATVSAAPPAPAAEPGWHTVVVGDTATNIARKYGISVKALLEMNGIADPDRILLGQRLKVPAR